MIKEMGVLRLKCTLAEENQMIIRSVLRVLEFVKDSVHQKQDDGTTTQG